MEILLKSALETRKLGYRLASQLKGVETIALFGDLGVGKTEFTKGIADFFGVEDMVSSPTFSIMNEYKCDKFNICHFDMYRVHSFEDLESTGFFEFIDKNIIIIEWSENVIDFIHKNCIKAELCKTDKENERILKLEGVELN